MGMCNYVKEALAHPRLRNVDMHTVLPFFLVPLLLYLGASCFTMTVLVMIILAMSMLYLLQRTWTNHRTQFFFAWTISSAFYLFLAFELIVLALLEVTQMENFVFLALVTATCWCGHKVRLAVDGAKGKDYSPVLTADSFHCPVCQIEINNRYFHSVWLDTCISSANYGYYLLGLCVSDICLLYGANLGLTTVCQPYALKYFPNILMPEDCSDVYYEYDLAYCFMSSVYSLCYALCITVTLLHQCVKYVPRHIRIRYANRGANVLSA